MSDNSSEKGLDQLDVLYEMARNLFQYSIERLRHADNKASIILAFFGILLIASFEIINWRSSSFVFPVLKYVPLPLIVIGTVFCLFALRPRILRAFPKLEPLLADYEKNVHVGVMKAGLISEYRNAASENMEIGTKKNKWAAWALRLAIATFFMVIFLYISKGEQRVCRFK